MQEPLAGTDLRSTVLLFQDRLRRGSIGIRGLPYRTVLATRFRFRLLLRNELIVIQRPLFATGAKLPRSLRSEATQGSQPANETDAEIPDASLIVQTHDLEPY